MAVYTVVEDEEVAALANDYGLGEVKSFVGIAEGVENSNYVLETADDRYILTLYEKRVNEHDLPWFLGLMDHLATRGIHCPVPIPDRDGKVHRRLAGKPAAIVSFLPGASTKRPGVGHCGALGAALAEMHIAGQGYGPPRINDQSVAAWAGLIETCGADIDSVGRGLGAELAAEITFLKENWPGDLPSGVIHADLFPDNVFFLGEEVSGLIDFYFACNDFFAYDLCICINAWCFELDGSFNITKARELLSAYHRVRPLVKAELDTLPVLARAASVRFLSTRLYDWLNQVEGALVKPKDPKEYLKRLRFHQGVESVSAYGLHVHE